MNTCVAEIITHTAGNTSRFRADSASVSEEEGCFRVEYSEEGDSVTLTLDADSFFMERRGNVFLSARFIAGEITSVRLKEGVNGGEIPVHTAKYSFTRVERGFCARLSYDLLFSTGKQHFYVTIRSEEK